MVLKDLSFYCSVNLLELTFSEVLECTKYLLEGEKIKKHINKRVLSEIIRITEYGT